MVFLGRSEMGLKSELKGSSICCVRWKMMFLLGLVQAKGQ